MKDLRCRVGWHDYSAFRIERLPFGEQQWDCCRRCDHEKPSGPLTPYDTVRT